MVRPVTHTNRERQCWKPFVMRETDDVRGGNACYPRRKQPSYLLNIDTRKRFNAYAYFTHTVSSTGSSVARKVIHVKQRLNTARLRLGTRVTGISDRNDACVRHVEPWGPTHVQRILMRRNDSASWKMSRALLRNRVPEGARAKGTFVRENRETSNVKGRWLG